MTTGRTDKPRFFVREDLWCAAVFVRWLGVWVIVGKGASAVEAWNDRGSHDRR